jgi:hypothetical protein
LARRSSEIVPPAAGPWAKVLMGVVRRGRARRMEEESMVVVFYKRMG